MIVYFALVSYADVESEPAPNQYSPGAFRRPEVLRKDSFFNRKLWSTHQILKQAWLPGGK